MDCYGRCGRPPAYIWTASPSGNELPLCAECCALWRADLMNDPEMSPARVRSIGELVP